MNIALLATFSLFLSVFCQVCITDGEGETDVPYYTELGSAEIATDDHRSPENGHFCNSSVVTYLSSFPCTDVEFDAVRNSYGDALRLLRTCDVFAYVASQLAVNQVNRHFQDIFTYPDNLNLPDQTLDLISGRGTQVSKYLQRMIKK